MLLPISLVSVGRRGAVGKNLVGKIIQYLTSEQYNNVSCINELLISGRYKIYPPNSVWETKMFAGKLKDIVCLLIGCTREQLENEEFKNTLLGDEWLGINNDCLNKEVFCPDDAPKDLDCNKCKYNKPLSATSREVLQILGTDLIRNQLHPNAWVNATMNEYIPIQYHDGEDFYNKGEYPNWIITDVRFLNEANVVKEKDGVLIRVNRACSQCGMIEGHKMIHHDPPVSDHISETALDSYQKFDYTIENSGTIEELIEKVKQILKKENIL